MRNLRKLRVFIYLWWLVLCSEGENGNAHTRQWNQLPGWLSAMCNKKVNFRGVTRKKLYPSKIAIKSPKKRAVHLIFREKAPIWRCSICAILRAAIAVVPESLPSIKFRFLQEAPSHCEASEFRSICSVG